MKKIILLPVLLLSAVMFSQTTKTTQWEIDQLHSKIGFSVTHMMVSETEGTFDTYKATLETSTEDFSDLEVFIEIEAASINTRNERRDKHLRANDFFDVEKYPTITFKSTETKKDENQNLLIIGDLTIRDTTKQITFIGIHKGTIEKDNFGLTRAGLLINTTINRQDFGVVYNHAIEAGGLALSNDIDIICKLSVTKGTNQ